MPRKAVIRNRRRLFLVNEHNHEWVAEHTGHTIEEIQAEYERAQREGQICWIKESILERA